ncbi:hypothetical protein ASG31_02560 [Chryseobacterium sp. Leaf404]|uniref:hypothetical protein n=1 Tax=Chryseobacterium TaxID=59732 RepID=UPI0006F39C58|nr:MULTISPECIES: hypothetical protein [Chryseobacterium]KQT22240.1 hypothetical protein ASG31_02560 [Chryseobacterium sp. Leaf404]
MNISYYDFKNLENQDQCNLVLHNGKIVNERMMKDLKYTLYEFSTFTVEVMHNLSSEKLAVINVFQNRAAYAV